MSSFWLPGVVGLVLLLRAGRLVDLVGSGRQREVLITLVLAGAVVWAFELARRAGWLTRLFPTRPARIAVVVLVAVAIAVILSPIISGFDPNRQIDLIRSQNLPPSFQHPFGTDVFSRDLWSRVLHGGRVSLAVGGLAMGVAALIGTLVGLGAGMGARSVDIVLMRIVDALLAVPRLVLVLVVIALWEGVSLAGLILVLGLTGWFEAARLVRAESMALKRRAFIVAARASGIGTQRLVVRHVLPNVLPPLIVAVSLGVGQMILLEAGLSFLGLGTQPPTASWGAIMQDGRGMLDTAPWVVTFPGLAVVVTVACLSLAGDGLRSYLNPKESDALR